MLWLTDTPHGSVGGKAEALMKLASAFTIPKGFVVTPEERVDESTVLAWFAELGADEVAVRSSAHSEDSSHDTWAGQLDTFLHVSAAEVGEKIAQCRASAQSARARSYAQSKHIESGEVAVVVQRMLKSRVSGVAFSRHPVTKEISVVTEAVKGQGEALVSGAVTPDTYVGTGARYLANEEPILQPVELQQVIDVTLQVEDALGYPVDIEWAFEGEELFLLQARPITTL